MKKANIFYCAHALLTVCMAVAIFQTTRTYASSVERTLDEQILFDSTLVEKAANVVGKAYGKNNQLLYTEKHYYIDINTHTVRYFDANGTLIADKQLDYQESAIRPALIQNNRQLRKTNKVRYQNTADGKRTIVIETELDGATKKQKEITINDKLVIDAGFNKFIQQHWQTLVDGNSMTMDFLLLNSGRTVNLRIQKNTQCESSLACFRITPSNFVFRSLSSPIYLQYNKDKQTLAQFKGKSNLANAKGKYPEVTIDYSYPNKPNETNIVQYPTD